MDDFLVMGFAESWLGREEVHLFGRFRIVCVRGGRGWSIACDSGTAIDMIGDTSSEALDSKVSR